ncbi:nucleoside recognition domain-containing protein [Desmospora activa]|uniref:Nucleoside recognition protein n=1 Tax=Desmospora activa DSM 45169 TaxID=1121389 RepID=A0A2T4Z440_9BACL|nr:nucleoside recognition domain-containing protein [Desmospora activa]PTM56647.1 nucleoside recognition protein [Desmospora activa DSM 45169]
MKRINWKKGLISGWSTAWELGKIIFPVTLAVSLLQHTPVIDGLVRLLTPAMSWLGLPGEAAIPLVLGNMLNLYAAIGAILTLDLTVKQVFILAVMLSFSHNLLLESAVCRRVGVNAGLVAGVRIGLAVITAVMIHWLWQGGDSAAHYGWITPQTQPEGWLEITGLALQTAMTGIFQLALVVFPLMMGIQILKDWHWLDRFADWMVPMMRPLGIEPRGSIIMASGLLFGLAMGAGVIIEQAREKGFSKRDMTLMILFLAACHAVVEDTLIFAPLGIDVLPLLLIRLGVAILMTLCIAWFWPSPQSNPAVNRPAQGESL